MTPPRVFAIFISGSRIPQASFTGWGEPVGTAVLNALSLTFPDGERLFMDAVRHYRGAADDHLQRDVRTFLAQEAMHARAHRGLNQLIDPARYPVAEIEADLQKLLALARARGPIGALIVTVALEHFAAMLADVHAGNAQLFTEVEPEIERLWRWHAIEETEHKAVAFDVFKEVTRRWPPWRRYLRRAVAMIFVTGLFIRFIERAAQLLEADGYSRRGALKRCNASYGATPGSSRAAGKYISHGIGRDFILGRMITAHCSNDGAPSLARSPFLLLNRVLKKRWKMGWSSERPHRLCVRHSRASFQFPPPRALPTLSQKAVQATGPLSHFCRRPGC